MDGGGNLLQAQRRMVLEVTAQIRSAGIATRLVYCLALFSFIPTTLLRSSGWIALTIGEAGGGLVHRYLFLLAATAVGVRIYQVLRYAHALDTVLPNTFVATVRVVSIAVMSMCGLFGLAIFFIRPLTMLLVDSPGDSGVVFYVIGLFLAFVAPFGWKACLVFEANRFLARMKADGAPYHPAYRWRQDGIVAAVLGALLFGAGFFRSSFVEAELTNACKQDRIHCVASVDERITRMASLPIGSPVRLVSNISSIRMQVHDGRELMWEAVEGVANSLKVSGYEPSNEEGLPVAVFVEATAAPTGPRLEIRVVERGEQVSQMTAVFSPRSRLESDAHSRINLLVPLPPRSDPTIRGSWRDDVDGYRTLDELYVFFRRAIGTEVEAQESRLRFVGSPQIVQRVDGGEVLEKPRADEGDFACNGRLHKTASKQVLSYAEADRAGRMMELRAVGTYSQPPMTYVHRTDDIVCTLEAIWIVHSVPIESRFSIKRFSVDGKLERFIEGELPVITNKTHAHIDAQSLREGGGAVWFDRIEVKLNVSRVIERKIVARETYKIQLPST